MAVDEVLLERACDLGEPALRIYHWSEPTLSLGYFQRHADRKAHVPSLNCAIVRRRSGGGAILHDREVTYALAMPVAARWGNDAEALYHTLHQAVIELLSELGCKAELYDGPVFDSEFLCFHRRAVGDVISGEHKLMGSAQRRSKTALLQHGSLLLQRSEFAPSLPGLLDLKINLAEVETSLASIFSAALTLQLVPTQLSDAEQRRTAEIAQQRFSADTWTHRK